MIVDDKVIVSMDRMTWDSYEGSLGIRPIEPTVSPTLSKDTMDPLDRWLSLELRMVMLT